MDMERIPATTVALMNGISNANFKIWKSRLKLIAHTYTNTMEYYSIHHLADKLTIARMIANAGWNWKYEQSTKPTTPYTSMEFFAGGGGLALGLEQAGFENKLCVEMNKLATQALRINRPGWNVYTGTVASVANRHFTEVDVISGGFPCQPFTVAGKQAGLDDTRGTAFFDFASVVREVKPKVVLAENVKGLINHDKGRTLAIIVSALESLGYTVQMKLLNSMFYQVPQSRERLIIIGIRNDLLTETTIPFQFPNVCDTLYSVRDAFCGGSLYEIDVPPSFSFSYNERTAFIMSHIPSGGNWKNLPDDLQREYGKRAYYDKRGGSARLGRRLSWEDPSPTLLTESNARQTGGTHPSEVRPLAIREYARIQTFPDSWQFYGSPTAQFIQIGNAVPVNMAAAVGRSIVRFLNQFK